MYSAGCMQYNGSGLLIALVLFVFVIAGCTTGKETAEEQYFPHLGNYADLYFRGSYDILHMVKYRELGKIGEATKVAAQKKMAGGTVLSRINTPHIMYGGAGAEDLPGNPDVAPDPKGHFMHYKGDPPLGEGDVLIAANPTADVEEAYKNGCYVIGVGFPMTTNRYSPPNYNDHPDYFIEDMSSIFIYSWGPKEDGLVMPALTPNLKILPTSPMTVVTYRLLTAQLAYNLAHKDTSGTYKAAEQYLDTLMSRLETFHATYIGDVQKAGETIAEKVLAGGKIHPWSGRDEFFIESNGTAGGLMGVYELNPDSLTSKDVVILATANATPDEEIEMARRVKEKGAWLLGIYPFAREDGISTAPLAELCDMSFDNLSGDNMGVLDIPGYDHKVVPTTTMMNNYAFWAIVGGYVQAMEARGEAPYYWMSYHVPGGMEYDESIRDDFLKRGY